MSKIENRVLVTGLVRFGTSWIGDMLSLSKGTIQIFEPFQPCPDRYPFGDKGIKDYFSYDGEQNPKYETFVKRFSSLNFNLYFDLLKVKNFRSLLRWIGKTVPLYLRSKFSNKILVKDPYSFFATKYYVKVHNYKAVVIIRHPGAFVESFMRNPIWDRHFYFNSLLNQTTLLNDFDLLKFKDDFERMAQWERDIVQGVVSKSDIRIRLERACLLWKVFAATYLRYKEENLDNVFLVRYEDIASSPFEQFNSLYNLLGFDYDITVEQKMKKFISSDEIESNKVRQTKRNTEAQINKWKSKLRKEDVEYINDYLSKEIYELYPEYITK